MTDSASVPAGKSADDSTMKSRANTYLPQLRRRFSFDWYFDEHLGFHMAITKRNYVPLAETKGEEKRGDKDRGKGKERKGGEGTANQEKTE